jgi:uncharacterized protein (DUF2141 family)
MLVPSLLAAWTAVAAPGIVVEVANVRSAQGVLYCTLHDRAETFPGGGEKAFSRANAPAQAGKMTLRFDGVPAGDYAVSCYHDENGNGRLDSNFLHIPTEGVAVSNDPKGHLGPPSFADARFRYAGGEQSLTVHLQY